MRRASSSPALGDRANSTAQLVGAKLAAGPGSRASNVAIEQHFDQDLGRLSSPNLFDTEPVTRPPSSAHEKTMQGFSRMPTESEILEEQIQGMT